VSSLLDTHCTRSFRHGLSSSLHGLSKCPHDVSRDHSTAQCRICISETVLQGPGSLPLPESEREEYTAGVDHRYFDVVRVDFYRDNASDTCDFCRQNHVTRAPW